MKLVRTVLTAGLLAACTALSSPAWGQDAAEVSAKVNINTADAETLAKALTGIGLTKAQAIVDHRERHGRFDQAADLARVKGIGEATVTRNPEKIVVGGLAEPNRSEAEG